MINPSLACLLVIACAGLAACGQTTVNAAGHQVTLSSSRHITDIGDYRIMTQRVLAPRAFDIPRTYNFSFAWSPTAYARLTNAQRLSAPTPADWRTFRARLLQGPRPITSSPERADAFITSLQQRLLLSGFDGVVLEGGYISACRTGSTTVAGLAYCYDGLQVSSATRREIAQIILDQEEPGCQIIRLDPPEITERIGGQTFVSTATRLVAVVDC